MSGKFGPSPGFVVGLGFGSFGEFGQGSFAARSGVFLEKAFFDGLVVLGLSFGHILSGRIGLEGFESGLDSFFDFLVVCGAFLGLASGFFGRFNNRH